MPTQPRSLPIINEQLKELREFIKRFQEVGATDFASDLHLSSLQYQESILIEELKAANLIQGNTAIQIAIDGSPVEDHAIDTAFLGPFLLYLQKLVNATGQALEGVPTSRGVIQERVQSQNRLRVSSLMATSFGLNFVVEDQLQSPSLFEDTPNNRTLDVVASLFNGDIKEEDAGSKADRARELGVTILTESEFLALVNENE